MIIGAQLYTVTKSCQTPEDLAETLKRVADMGYRSVQLSGVCEYDPAWMDEQLKKNGLVCALTHTAPSKILEDVDKVCRDHAAIGCKNIGIGMMPRNESGLLDEATYADFKAKFTEPMKRIRDNGFKFYYHNHHYEFARCADGRWLIDHMIDDFSTDLLNFTLDMYWVQFGGCDPVEWLYKLKGRLECIHLKDLAIVGKEQRMAPIGAGNLNWEKILVAAEEVGTKHALVEQDKSYDDDPFDCLKKSLDYLRALGYND